MMGYKNWTYRISHHMYTNHTETFNKKYRVSKSITITKFLLQMSNFHHFVVKIRSADCRLMANAKFSVLYHLGVILQLYNGNLL